MADNRHLFCRRLGTSQPRRAQGLLRFDPVWDSSVTYPRHWFPIAVALSSIQLRNCANIIRLPDSATIGGVQRGISNLEVEHISDEEAVTVMSDHHGATGLRSTFIQRIAPSQEGRRNSASSTGSNVDSISPRLVLGNNKVGAAFSEKARTNL
jgi:hypothetical protein